MICAYCRAEVETPVTCPVCATALHPECATELGECPTLGCSGRLAGMAATSKPERPSLKGDAPLPRRRVAVLVGLLLLLAATALWALDLRNPFRPRPSFPHQRLLLIPLQGTDPELVTAIESGIEREYGLPVELIEDCPAPSEANQHDRRGSRLLDGDTLIAQGARILEERKVAPGVGFLVVTHRDITDPGANFVFGLADPGRGVMSYARFSELAGPGRLERRSVAQALSSTGLILGIPRCQTRGCARAYPDTVLEQDAKRPMLCDPCLRDLVRRSKAQ